MDEAVIVIADLYLHAEEPVPAAMATDPGALAGLEYVGRFGERERLSEGWRRWLAHWLGRGDLARVSVAAIAAAAPPAGRAVATRWIATPVALRAGLTRAHLARHDGILRLRPEEQRSLVSAFERTFGGSGLVLEPLSDGQFLLMSDAIAPIPTTEPARCAGGELTVPQGPAAASLLRLVAEIEMWLHGEALNESRTARGAPPVTSLWLWGAEGEALPSGEPPRAAGPDGASRGATLALGADAYLTGLARLAGAALEALPEGPAALWAERRAARAVLLAELAGAAPDAGPWSLPAAAAALDRRLVRPALAALSAGRLARLTLIANDTRITLGRLSGLRRWRRPRPGLGAFA
ncbi:MAG TPA: hypothetical protein VEG26_10885 [Steroidobacteraceae bacterium]|nr:hypothetical protein [Steroidobacteraceae bacterium]